MNDIVDILSSNNIVLKSLHTVDKKSLGTRKNIKIFNGVDLKSNYVSVYQIYQKARFIKSHYEFIELLHKKNESTQGHTINKVILIVYTQVCSKIKEKLKKDKWKLIQI